MDKDNSAIALPNLEVQQDDHDQVDDDSPRTGEARPEVEAAACDSGQQADTDLGAQKPGDPEEGSGRHRRG